ncbi:MAG: cytochrome C [Nitrospinae bacterium]|nr:cytochrome C [Nitrospinota bacterium]
MEGKKGNSELGKILGYGLFIMVAFAGYAKFGIPLVIPEAPPVEEKITGAMTKDQFVAMGDKIFHGKGTCTLCHSPVGGRAPILDTVGSKAAERLKDARYKGKAKTGEEYIRESMVDPSAFVVAGFGKPGSNDSVSPMPNINKGAIGLNDVEINSVIAYLQKSGGAEVTVPLPTGAAPAAPAGAEAAAPTPAATAEEAFNKFGCVTCHKVPGIAEGGDMGPDLTKLAKAAGSRKPGMSGEMYIIESISNPNAYVVKGFEPDMMPADLGNSVTMSEMNLIVNALLGKK